MSGKKALLLGLGNSILGDDGVGLVLAEKIKNELKTPEITVERSGYFGIALLDYFLEYAPVFIIDSLFIDAEKAKPGELSVKSFESSEELPTSRSAHRIDVPSLLMIVKKLEGYYPDTYFYGIHIDRVQDFREGLSPEIENKMTHYEQTIIKDLRNRLNTSER